MKCLASDPDPDSPSRSEAFCCPSIKQTLVLWWAKAERQFAYLQQKHKNFFISLWSPTQLNKYLKDKTRLPLNTISCLLPRPTNHWGLLKHSWSGHLLASVGFPYLCKRDSRKGSRSSLKLPPHNSPTPGTRRSTAATLKGRKLI